MTRRRGTGPGGTGPGGPGPGSAASGSPGFDAVLLAGGAGRRLGGVDKPAMTVGGRRLLDVALSAVAAADRVVAVGPERPGGGAPRVRWAREQPPGTGPLAGLAAGLAALDAMAAGGRPCPVVVVLAADLPRVRRSTVASLVARLGAEDRPDAAVVADASGRRQPLLAAYRRAALDAAVAGIGDPAGRPVRWLLDRMTVATVADPVAATDVDTPADLAALAEEEGTVLEAWMQQLCAALGLDPADVDVGLTLDLARDAAHHVQRPAAPLTTFLVGYAAGLAGGGRDQVAAAAATATQLALAQQPPGGGEAP